MAIGLAPTICVELVHKHERMLRRRIRQGVGPDSRDGENPWFLALRMTAMRGPWATIMRTAAFSQGVNDVRSGAPVRYDTFADDNYWAYERGRLWALLAPRSMPLRDGKRLNPEAIALFARALRAGEIL